MNEDTARDARRMRWVALSEDKPIFGLVPAEEAELVRLNEEFGEWKSDEHS